MKLFVTDKWIYNEQCKAREEVEKRYWEREEHERLNRRMCELEQRVGLLENRVERLENLIGKSYTNKIDDCATSCEPLLDDFGNIVAASRKYTT